MASDKKPEVTVEVFEVEAPQQPEVTPDVVLDPKDTHREGVDLPDTAPEEKEGSK